MSRNNNEIRELVRSLYQGYTPAIYAGSIARVLQYPVDKVEAELYCMVEEEKLLHIYELRCCQCGHVIATAEDPVLFTGGPAECPGCWTQTESITMNDVISAFVPANHK